MKKGLVAAVLLVVIGLIALAAVMASCGWDLTKLETENFITNTYEITEGFDGISIDTQTADIAFAVSDDGVCRVICTERENEKHAVCVDDGVLLIETADERKWYERIGFSFRAVKLTVCLPETEYATLSIRESTGDIEVPAGFTFDAAALELSTGDVRFSASVRETLKIKTSTGDIRIENMTAGALELSVSTGEVTVSDTTCGSLTSSGSTGDAVLTNVTAEGALSVERSTGDVKLDGCDAEEIFVKTSTGDVTGRLRTDKVFVTETSTGSVQVPGTASGGKCGIVTSTGDIRFGEAK